MRVILEVIVGLQVRHIDANGIKNAIRQARSEGVPEHLIRAGTVWVQSNVLVADWIDAMARAEA